MASNNLADALYKFSTPEYPFGNASLLKKRIDDGTGKN
jgi:hypothetical protein